MADPLPSKIGEIGYLPPVEEEEETTTAEQRPRSSSIDGMNAAQADARNGRHPADNRSQTNLAGSSSRNASHTTINMPMPPKSVSSRIWSKKFGGITVGSIVRFSIVAFIVIGTIVGWVFAAKSVAASSHNNSGSGGNNSSSISPIFLHLLFAVVVIIELIILERCLFRLRAERYAHMHPGEMLLPLHRNATTAQIAARGMPMAPWNRPSLPTYAAALGFRGTGDVEDNLIAAPPPPAYGNTRGSTLLLTTIVQNRSTSSLSRRNDSNTGVTPSRRSSSSMHSGDSMLEQEQEHDSRPRPISYDTSEQQTNIQRAQRLEEALSRSQENNAERS
ncbi:hypothetical protein Clacol_010100 [Clathrus columnatus]|uniref:Uncharacterized protein n=1 Tax=Clathrus columnatus TaxID=1419009 RepID=A0AAV5APY8_9AGAM|nr:hypothetical protein Clacol_010100 [Clathrus columnatus]